jgi:hypothetical protein
LEPDPITKKQGFEQEASTQEGDLSREKKRKARQANAEKQKRYRKSMRAQGYRARLIWEKPLGPGWTRAAAPVIRESSVGIVQNSPAIGEVREYLCGIFIMN